MKRLVRPLSLALIAPIILLGGCVPPPVAAPAAVPVTSAPTATAAAPTATAAAPAEPTASPAPALPEPADNQPLSAILRMVEERQPGSIVEAELEDGLWEVKVCDADGCQNLYLNPRSGEEVRRRKAGFAEAPPAGALPLSTIVQSVEALGLGFIEEVEFDDGAWEFELHKDGRETKLIVDPLTGEQRARRGH